MYLKVKLYFWHVYYILTAGYINFTGWIRQ